jgi:hypothetical protein
MQEGLAAATIPFYEFAAFTFALVLWAATEIFTSVDEYRYRLNNKDLSLPGSGVIDSVEVGMLVSVKDRFDEPINMKILESYFTFYDTIQFLRYLVFILSLLLAILVVFVNDISGFHISLFISVLVLNMILRHRRTTLEQRVQRVQNL